MVITALTPNSFGPDPGRAIYARNRLDFADAAMVAMLRSAGGLPFIVSGGGAEHCAEALAQAAAETMDVCRALVLAGGADWGADRPRDSWEIALYRAALDRKLPVLGICRGLQLLNVAEGGTLVADIPSERPSAVAHRADDRDPNLQHPVRWSDEAEEQWVPRYGALPATVNSVHHQALDRVADCFQPLATAPDGTVEAMIHRQRPDVIGVQWHPEWMVDNDPIQRGMIQRWLSSAAQAPAS